MIARQTPGHESIEGRWGSIAVGERGEEERGWKKVKLLPRHIVSETSFYREINNNTDNDEAKETKCATG